MPTFTLEGYQFMRAHGASSYCPAVETREQGAVRSALELARAEHTLRQTWEASVEWSEDPYADVSWMDAETHADHVNGRTVMMSACLWRGTEILASLSGIHMSADWRRDPYRRVVEAQLALEAGICHPLDRDIS